VGSGPSRRRLAAYGVTQPSDEPPTAPTPPGRRPSTSRTVTALQVEFAELTFSWPRPRAHFRGCGSLTAIVIETAGVERLRFCGTYARRNATRVVIKSSTPRHPIALHPSPLAYARPETSMEPAAQPAATVHARRMRVLVMCSSGS
jgi:hypothetical protein